MTIYTFDSNGSMIYLNLAYNSLSGNIPDKFGSMNHLQFLNLGHNKITGNIPNTFGGLKEIGVLDLSHNNLQGFIPASLGTVSFLSDLDVSNNNLSGPIPSGGSSSNSYLRRKKQSLIEEMGFGVQFFLTFSVAFFISFLNSRFARALPSLPKPVSHVTIHQGLVGDFYDLEKLCVVGHGNHGIVYKVRHRPTSAIYALKMVQEEENIITNSCVSHELEILACTNSPFIVKCHGIFEPRAGEKAILMEYMDAGTLDTLLKANGPFPETLLAHIAHQALNGLSYLHACKIVHLDIKPSNLLVNKDMKVKIGDFGVSRIVHGSTTSYDNLGSQGTYAYMSPERLDSGTFGSSSEKDIYAGDVWSLGVTLWELSVGHFPFFTPGKRPSWMEVAIVICLENSLACQNKHPTSLGASSSVAWKGHRVKGGQFRNSCPTLLSAWKGNLIGCSRLLINGCVKISLYLEKKKIVIISMSWQILHTVSIVAVIFKS
ncbi:hypothetical protein GH714_028990 [Hevea brasiliensis]|uniref:Protein kinase domain-containing protein n=1 Tax=Hevea brasiliensis TaxID=3981 RepID=A0A6A6KXM5_HEVBR|nr:hypothetical protein GH714_028990 [Hevea brasiliensis]